MKIKIYSMIKLFTILFFVGFLNFQTHAQTVSVQNSSANLCNGSATLLDSTAIISSITWNLNNGSTTQGVTSISNLCPGVYVVVYAFYLNPTTIDSMSLTFVVGTSSGCGLNAYVNTTDSRDSVSCDGTASASATGGTSPYSYVWNNLATTVNQTSLCPGNYCVTVTDANGCAASACSLISITGGGNTSNGTVSVQNASPNACDGTATLVDSNAVVSSITWYLNNGTMPQGVTSISNLCPGTYTVVYTYNVNPTTVDSTSITFVIGTANGCNGLTVSVTTTDSRDSISCDGTANVSATGGAGAYTFLWNTAAITANQISLCPGNYCVTVTDANGCTATDCGVVFILGAPNNGDTLVIVNGTCGGANSMGTITGTTNDCNLDYSLVASGSMTSSTSFFPDSVQTVWSVFDSLGNTLATYNVTYNFPLNTNSGCYDLVLAISCDTSLRRSGANPIIVIYDAVNVTASSLTQVDNNNINIINPVTNNQLQIFTDSGNLGQISITDIQGRVILNTEINDNPYVNIDISYLPAGIYMVQINNGKNLISRKIIKI
jgi:hypothetical protein